MKLREIWEIVVVAEAEDVEGSVVGLDLGGEEDSGEVFAEVLGEALEGVAVVTGEVPVEIEGIGEVTGDLVPEEEDLGEEGEALEEVTMEERARLRRSKRLAGLALP